MSVHTAVISWQRHGAQFTDNRYSRQHQWAFDGGATVLASASPQVVPLPYSVVEGVDPEEAFVASLASCHMLWFLSVAAGRNFVVDRYRDEATAALGRNSEGKEAITRVTLRPHVGFAGTTRPSPAEHATMHHEAHDRCFIANSVRTELLCEPLDVTELA